jgi:hypothetical protein
MALVVAPVVHLIGMIMFGKDNVAERNGYDETNPSFA